MKSVDQRNRGGFTKSWRPDLLPARGLRLLGTAVCAVGFAGDFQKERGFDWGGNEGPGTGEGLSPAALAVSADGRRLFVACATADQVVVLDTVSGDTLGRVEVGPQPIGLALSRDSARLYVACAAPQSSIGVLDVGRMEIVDKIPAGHTAVSPVLSRDEKTLYVCNRFDQDVGCVDLERGRLFRRIRVGREPIAATLTPDGQYLLVAHHLQSGTANRPDAAATLSLVDTTSGTVAREIALRPGSGLVRSIAVSPDGAYAAVPHVLAHYHWLPRMAYLGWINQNAVSFIDLQSRSLLATVTLDEDGRGAANPWAVAWSDDGQSIWITHAGTHEVSVIKASALLAKIHALPDQANEPGPAGRPDRRYYNFPRFGSARTRFDLPSDFRFLEETRTRFALSGIGPRALMVAGPKIYIAHYFSDSVEVLDMRESEVTPASIDLSSGQRPSLRRQGERWFNDATLCVQGWQSCSSCHDADARVDGFNWDLLNDGPHNPKNTRSLLLSPSTPPVMALGVRDSTRTAVRAGLQHILFCAPPSGVPEAIDRFLESLQPLPSPHRVGGRLSAAAERGQRIFARPDVGCARCHPAPLFTDLRAYDVGTAGDYDQTDDRFDTPSLIESWRTGPYLHDGSAATLHDVLTRSSASHRHGRTSQLTPGEVEDLAEFVLSL